MKIAGGKLGLWMCVALVTGNMIGSGIFLLPASLAPYGGISIVGWVITAAGSIALALVFARLSYMVPKAGGPYAYTRLGFGDFAGFLVAWGYWISILATNAAIAVAFVSYLTVFWPALARSQTLAALTALGAIWLLTGVNAVGVRAGGHVQLATTALKLMPLLAIAVFGLFYFDAANLAPAPELASAPLPATTAAVALTLWAFLGLESATVPAGDVVAPERTIPRATLIGTSLTAVIYIVCTVAVMGVMSPEALGASEAPFADAARLMWGGWAGYLVAAGAAVSCFGALNGWILLQGQVPLAAARDRLFPEVFGRVSGNGTPVAGMLISSVLVTLLMATNYARALVPLFTFVILLATLSCLIPYLFSTMAEVLIARRAGRSAGPSIVAVIAFAYSLWAIAGSGAEAVYWGFILLLAGIPVHVWMKWRRTAGRPGERP